MSSENVPALGEEERRMLLETFDQWERTQVCIRSHVRLIREWVESLLATDELLREAQRKRDKLGNALAQEQAKPGGSFDQWDALQAAEQALQESRLEVERLREALEQIADKKYGSGYLAAYRFARAALAPEPEGGR